MATNVASYGIGRPGGMAATMGYGATVFVLARIPDKACILIGADPSARCLTSADGSTIILVSANPKVMELIAADPSFHILEGTDPRVKELKGRKDCC